MASISLDECFAWLNVVYQYVSQCTSYVQKMMIKLCRKTICRFSLSLSIWIDARRRMSSWLPMLFRPENIFRTSYARVRMRTSMTIVNFLCDLNAKKRSVFLFLYFFNAMKQVDKLVVWISPSWLRSIEHQQPKKQRKNVPGIFFFLCEVITRKSTIQHARCLDRAP